MNKKPYPVQKITKGLNVDLNPMIITDQESPNNILCSFQNGLLKKDLGFKFFAGINERPMLFDTFYQQDGGEYLVLVTTEQAYYYSSTLGAFVSITGSDVFTGDADDGFCSAIFRDSVGTDIFILTNGLDAIQKWDGSNWAVLGGCVASGIDSAKVVIPFCNCLFLMHTTETGTICPFRLRWSDIDNPEEYDHTTTNAGFYDLDETVDWITGAALLGDRLFVFKERSIWEILYVGLSTKLFDYKLVVDAVGTYAPDTIMSLGDALMFFGSDNIYAFDGVNLKSVGDNIYPWLYETNKMKVNQSKINRASAAYMEETGDYLLALPTKGSDPDWLLKFNVTDETWTQRFKDIYCFGYYTAATRTTWTDATGTWSDVASGIPWIYKNLPAGAPITLYATPGTDTADAHWEDVDVNWEDCDITFGYYTIEADDRTVYSTELMTWESKDWIWEHASRVTEVRFLCKGDPFSFSYSLDGGVSWSNEVTLTPSTTEFSEVVSYLNLTTLKFRVRVRTYSEQIEIQWVEPWFIPRVRSKTLL